MSAQSVRHVDDDERREAAAVRLQQKFGAKGFRVEHGEFGADMKVASVNDGPVTLLFDTDNL